MTEVRILESDSNRRGDLFGRLMSDVLLAVGYDRARFNVHKAGREVDIIARHRTEPRVAVAECKATKALIGGDDFNKFYGVLDLERRRNEGLHTQGYFISLAGYRETALEQEIDAGEERFITLDGQAVVDQLVSGRIIVSPARTAELVGAAAAASGLTMDPDFHLLAHSLGWMWCVYFTQNLETTHFALVHAGGTLLAPQLAHQVKRKDADIDGPLASLTYLPPQATSMVPASLPINAAPDQYFAFLARELGEITLEGLPADQEAGSRRIRLENLFVPLHLERLSENSLGNVGEAEADRRRDDIEEQDAVDDDDEWTDDGEPSPVIADRIPVADALATTSRLAILASPGAGKSTLLKRLAVAYAFPERRQLSADGLPEREWFPLLLRCRQLSGDDKPIRELLSDIPRRAEIPQLSSAFEQVIADRLVRGQVLLLIDGLDEISDDRQRVAFAKQLRTFLSTYPNVSAVVTSREAGFRVVGATLGSVCEHFRLADFDDEDIQRLTIAWHREVVGDSAQTTADAEALAHRISQTDRVRRLAQNPLLLTTLLLVKRWLGDLPRKRSVLYGKAIEVLLMTWNVEGHEPIDQEEAVPQLAFVAHAMSEQGNQAVSASELHQLLQRARNEMPEVLGYARIPVGEFVSRIEDRSSVLSLVGHRIEAGRLTAVYEFKHLTFQEYLTALATVEGYYGERANDASFVDKLMPHIREATWREIVPLAAVLAGRRASPLIEYLISVCDASGGAARERRSARLDVASEHERPRVSAEELLLRCIADEVQVTPHLLAEAARAAGRCNLKPFTQLVEDVIASRYGGSFSESISKSFISGAEGYSQYDRGFAVVALIEAKLAAARGHERSWRQVGLAWLGAGNPRDQAAGALVAMRAAYEVRGYGRRDATDAAHESTAEVLGQMAPHLVANLSATCVPVAHASSWALAWLGEGGLVPLELREEVIRATLSLWQSPAEEETQRMAAWAFSRVPLVDRDLTPIGEPSADLVAWLRQQAGDDVPAHARQDRRPAALVAGYYLRDPWSDDELVERIKSAEVMGFGVVASRLSAALRRGAADQP